MRRCVVRVDLLLGGVLACDVHAAPSASRRERVQRGARAGSPPDLLDLGLPELRERAGLRQHPAAGVVRGALGADAPQPSDGVRVQDQRSLVIGEAGDGGDGHTFAPRERKGNGRGGSHGPLDEPTAGFLARVRVQRGRVGSGHG